MADRPNAVLSEFDRGTATWHKLKAHLQARLEMLRTRNEKHVDERKTSQLRSSINELKYLISLDQDKPQEPPENELFKD